MNSKLTLSINHEVKEKAKEYAKAHNTSVSKIVEQYLDNLASANDANETWKEHLSPIVRDMVGTLDPNKIIDDERYQYLMKKYS